MIWQVAYKLPLHFNENCPPWVRDFDNNHALDIFVEGGDDELIKEIIDVLNGKSDKKFSVRTTKTNSIWLHKGNTDAVIIIRGWGHLTGIGGLNFSEEEAVKIQDSFQKWIVNKLKKENNDA